MKYTYCIWDFNGTILDDLEFSIIVANKLLSNHNLPLITKEEYQSKFCFPIIDFYIDLGFDLKKNSYESLASEYMDLMAEYNDSLIFGDVISTLTKLRENSIKNVIISASDNDSLFRQLKSNNIFDLFDKIIGKADYLGYGKEQLALNWKKLHKDEKIVYLGDSDHDAQIAKMIGADCILISRGHQSLNKLKNQNPLAICNTLDEVLPFIL